MKTLCVTLALGLGSAGLLLLNPGTAAAQQVRGNGAHGDHGWSDWHSRANYSSNRYGGGGFYSPYTAYGGFYASPAYSSFYYPGYSSFYYPGYSSFYYPGYYGPYWPSYSTFTYQTYGGPFFGLGWYGSRLYFPH